MPFVYRRRVQFAETDLAGFVHFSWHFRYMEEAEHALWRAAGLTIARAGENVGWPRVSAAFDYRAPLYFEDEFEVRVVLASVRRTTLEWTHAIWRDETLIGEGRMTTIAVDKSPGAPMKAKDVPGDIVEQLKAAAG